MASNQPTTTHAQRVQDALDRAITSQALTNYPAIFAGFMEKGIPESEIKPRENVFTFNAWKALGRSVKKGEHGVKVVTFIEASARDISDTGEETVRTYRKPHTTTVFHISQTELEGERQARRPAADYRTPRRSAWASGHGRYPSVDSYPDPGELAADRWNETH